MEKLKDPDQKAWHWHWSSQSKTEILCAAASVLSVQARNPQTLKTSLQISAPPRTPKGKPTGEASRLDLQASGVGGWIKAEEWGDWPGRNSWTGGVDPEKFRNHGCAMLCQPVSCCVRNYMGPAWFSATYGDIKLGWRVTTDTTWCRFRWADCLEDLEDWLLLGTARKLRMLNELERSLGKPCGLCFKNMANNWHHHDNKMRNKTCCWDAIDPLLEWLLWPM